MKNVSAVIKYIHITGGLKPIPKTNKPNIIESLEFLVSLDVNNETESN